MLITLLVFIVIYLKYLKIEKNKLCNYIMISFIISVFLSILFPLLNYNNSISFSDISDAEFYVNSGKLVNENLNNIFLRDSRYWGYSFIMSLIYKFSLNSNYLYIASATLLNFMLLTLLLLRILDYKNKKWIKLKDNYLKIFIFNPAFYLIPLSTTRDTFIFFIIFNLFLDLFFSKSKLKIIGIISNFIFLYFFREDWIVIIFILLIYIYFFNILYKKIKKVKYLTIVIIFITFFFVSFTFIPPDLVGANVLLYSYGSDVERAENLFGKNLVLSLEERNKVNKNSFLDLSLRRFTSRMIPSFFDGSFLKTIYLNISGQAKKYFYNTNFIKVTLYTLYQIYNYFILFPFIFIILLKKHNQKNPALLFSLLFYIIIFISYTIMFGNFQARNRFVSESLILFATFQFFSHSGHYYSFLMFKRAILITSFFSILWIIITPY